VLAALATGQQRRTSRPNGVCSKANPQNLQVTRRTAREAIASVW